MPKIDDFYDFGGLNGVFVTVTHHKVSFWIPWNRGNAQEVFLEFLVTIRMIRMVENSQKMMIWMILDVWMGCFVIDPQHMIYFWNPWNSAFQC